MKRGFEEKGVGITAMERKIKFGKRGFGWAKGGLWRGKQGRRSIQKKEMRTRMFRGQNVNGLK